MRACRESKHETQLLLVRFGERRTEALTTDATPMQNDATTDEIATHMTTERRKACDVLTELAKERILLLMKMWQLKGR